MDDRRQKIIDIATSKIGQKEATGHNDGEIVQWAISQWVPENWDANKPNPETGKVAWASWCAGFASTCYQEAGIDFKKIGSLSVDTLLARLIKCGKKVYRATDDYTPMPGDFIFFGDTGNLSHVGLVHSVVAKKILTIEGNHGNAVGDDSYDPKKEKIWGYCNYFDDKP